MNDDARIAPPLPRIYSPFDYRVNPNVERVREHLNDWTARTGLIRAEAARRRFARADFGWFAAMVYPTASLSHANLMADWFAWLFLVDDQLDDNHAGHDPQRFREVVDQMRTVLDSPTTTAQALAERGVPAVGALADLWSRTSPYSTSGWRQRFVRHLEDCLSTATTWEAANRSAGIVPDEATYIPKRRHTGAIYVCMDFIDIVAGLDVDADVYASPAFTDALHSACDVVCWTNDIYSYAKERDLGEVHNFVHVVSHHNALDTDAALRRVNDAIAAETKRFLTKERQLLLAFPQHAQHLNRYLDGMRSWMRGNLDWSRATKRYRPSDRDQPEEYLETAIFGVDG